MRQPDITGERVWPAISPDVFIGRPECPAIGRIDHGRAVITYPKIKVEKARARSDVCGGEIAVGVLPIHIDRFSVLDDSIHR